MKKCLWYVFHVGSFFLFNSYHIIYLSFMSSEFCVFKRPFHMPKVTYKIFTTFSIPRVILFLVYKLLINLGYRAIGHEVIIKLFFSKWQPSCRNAIYWITHHLSTVLWNSIHNNVYPYTTLASYNIEQDFNVNCRTTKTKTKCWMKPVLYTIVCDMKHPFANPCICKRSVFFFYMIMLYIQIF